MKVELRNQDNQNLNIETLLVNRGIPQKQVKDYLNADTKYILDPRDIENMEEGVNLLLSTLNNGDKIFLQVDSDCDGYTSAAILINYLYLMDKEYINDEYFSYRLHEGKEHGLIYEYVPADADLVIAIDASSNDYEVHKQLAERGQKVLVVDHHESEKYSEHAVVINNQMCDYPSKALSGAGMIFKFICLLDEKTGNNFADLVIDLASVGIIGDMMDMRDMEVRALTNIGLHRIRNPFLMALVAKNSYSLKDKVTPYGTSFYLVPNINGMIRAGTMEEKELMFKAMLYSEGVKNVPSTKRGATITDTEVLAEQAVRVASNVRNRQNRVRDADKAKIYSLIENYPVDENKAIVLILDTEEDYDFDNRLTGLVANQLMAQYKKPIILFHHDKNSDTLSGSSRGYSAGELEDFKAVVETYNNINYASGHANAFGTSIPADDYNSFIEHLNNELEDIDFSPKYIVDYIGEARHLSSSEVLEIAKWEYLWGQEMPTPSVYIKNIPIADAIVTLMSPDRNPTLKIVYDGISYIKFKSSEEEVELVENARNISVVGEINLNEFNGSISPQIFIKDYELNNQVSVLDF